jgi:hypothetical protein
LQLENDAEQELDIPLDDFGSEHGNNNGCCTGHKPSQKNPCDEKARLRNLSRKSMKPQTLKSLPPAGSAANAVDE